jgi:hypothetical protein
MQLDAQRHCADSRLTVISAVFVVVPLSAFLLPVPGRMRTGQELGASTATASGLLPCMGFF